MMQRTLLSILVLAVGLFAQDGGDPFAANGKLRRGGDARAREALPVLTLKGFIQDKSGNAIALVDVGGKRTHLLRKGDELTLSAQLPLKVTELNQRQVIIEIAGRKVVVR